MSDKQQESKSKTLEKLSDVDPAEGVEVGAKEVWHLRLAALWSSKLGIAGMLITTVSASLILAALITEFTLGGLGPYQGMITYMLLPAGFIGGLMLMPLGMWMQRRRALRGEKARVRKLMLDLTNPRHQRLLLFVIGMSVINLALISVLGYEAYHFTESTAFCGKLCHVVMEPEYNAHQRSPHARVDCVECHIGSGASWFVKAKISGLRQVYGVLTGDFSRPIPTPVHGLRPPRDTCEQCHWPEVFHGNRPKVFRRYNDETTRDNPEISAVVLHVGGQDKVTGDYSGIHRHVSHDIKVEYLASDEKHVNIKEVRVTRPDGSIVQYVKKNSPEVPKGREWRTMNCIDCHNRPTHIYDTPEGAVDREIWMGHIPSDLPEYRSTSLAAVTAEYESHEAAEVGILEHLQSYYAEKHPQVAKDRADDISKLAQVLYDKVYKINVYPHLKIRWNTYFSHLGHRNDTGCFRCHDDEHESPSGETISQDCDTCHNLVVEEELLSDIDDSIKDLIF